MDLDAFLSSPLPAVIGGALIIVAIGITLAIWDARRFDREQQARAKQTRDDKRPPTL